MGYCTTFTLWVTDGDKTVKEILEIEDGFEGLHYAVDGEGGSLDEVKWYKHDDDMRELSAKYPESTFLLEGVGEEGGDMWRKFFRNGKMQYCPAIITYDSFDENKLA